MSTELFLNFLGIRMDSRKAEGMRFTINLITPDNGEKFLVELENATLTNIKGFPGREPEPHPDDQPRRPGANNDGSKNARLSDCGRNCKGAGRRKHLEAACLTLVDFDPRFEIMPGTKAKGSKVAHADDYEAVPRPTIAE